MALKVTSCGPKNGKPGYLKIYNGKELIVYLECNYFAPYKRALKHKTGKWAKSIRAKMLEVGCIPEQCDYILQTGKYDPRNEGIYHRTPQEIISEQRKEANRLSIKARRLKKLGLEDS